MRLALLLAAAVILIRDPTGKWANDPLRPWFRPLIASLVFCAVSAAAAIAMDRGQFANVPPEVREWFEHLRSPNGVPCCSYADGHRTGYDMRQGQYWVLIEGEWYPVPSEAVIKTANPVGEAIVWYVSTYADVRADPKYRVLCFVPSDGV